MTTELDPLQFAADWCEAWNAHDLDRVLQHFHEDIIFSSPVAARLFPKDGGVVRGKAALRGYWQEGLRRLPNLRFTVQAVFAGVDTLVIQYLNQSGVSVSEVLIFEDGLVREGHGTYAVPPVSGG